MNNADPLQQAVNNATIPCQYSALLEKEQQTATANIATIGDSNDSSNESESTHPDPEDQLNDSNEQQNCLYNALVMLTAPCAAFLNV
jgi:hypothetical protein